MIDIGRLFKGSKEPATTKVVVAALAVEKREDMAPVREAIQKAGFKVDAEIEREDGAVLYPQVENFDEAACTVYKVNGDVLALMTGTMVAKAEQTGFIKDLFGRYGYVPSMQEASQAVVQSVLTEAGNVTEENFEGFQTMMKSDFSELANYISDTLVSMPANLFDIKLPEVVAKSEVADGAEDDATDVGTGEGEEAPAEEAPAAEGEAEGGVEVAKAETDIAALIAKAMGPVATQMGDMVTALTGISREITTLKSEVSDIKEGQTELASKVDEVDTVAKAANEAVGGTIVSSAPPGDKKPVSRIVKAEDSDPRQGVFDTAFLPGARH